MSRPSSRQVYCPCPLCAEWRLANHQAPLPGDAKALGVAPPLYEDLYKLVARDVFPKPLREYTSAERKGMPVHKGVMIYFPDALAAVARVSRGGNDTHVPSTPLVWDRTKSPDHLDCAARHLLTPDTIDDDTGALHLANAAWRLLAALQLAEEKRLVAAGIKPLSGITE